MKWYTNVEMAQCYDEWANEIRIDAKDISDHTKPGIIEDANLFMILNDYDEQIIDVKVEKRLSGNCVCWLVGA